MRRRCPVCHWEFTIPTAEQVAALARRSQSEYALSRPGNRPVPESSAYQTYLAVVCRVCGTRMYATPEQVGDEMECPDCGTFTKVAPPVVDPAESSPRPAPAEVEEDYPIYQGEAQPPADRREVHQTYVPVICGVCRTRMLATLDQVGQEMICPDCGTPSIVPPPVPKESSGPAASAESGSPYGIGVWNWWELGVKAPAGSNEVVTVCPLCHTRLNVSADAADQWLECPDCGTSFDAAGRKVEPVKTEPNESMAEETDEEEYGIVAREATADLRPAVFPESESAEPPAEDEPRTLRSIQEEEPEQAPRWPFLTGVFSFPFYSNSLLYWVALSVGAMGIAALGREAYQLTQGSALGWVLSILFGVFGGLLAVIWAIGASAIGLAIVQDTSDGYDRIVNWPEGTVFEWFPEFLFVLNSVSLSLIAGLALRALLGADTQLTGMVLAATAYVLFPLLLISMLEGGSPWKPFSWPIWRTLFTVVWAWGLFYVETALIGLAIVLPAGLLAATHPIAAVPGIAIIVAAMMIYFRLLGRLVWYCAQRLPDKEEPEDEESTAEEDSE